MKWYVPSWHGDVRIVSRGKETVLFAERPTDHERSAIMKFLAEARRRKWTEVEVLHPNGYQDENEVCTLDASVSAAGALLAGIMRPGRAVITAARLSGGKIEVVSGDYVMSVEEFGEYVERMDRQAEKVVKEREAVARVEEVRIATLRRPTPSCPSCMEGAIGPASEVLLSFLDEDEHSQWSKSRTIVVQGGASGHRYLLAHRHSDAAKRIGRICLDLDDDFVMHFHDWSVPPEEEVLAAMLCLKYRESWLRNEATMFGYSGLLFKNPFGEWNDGVWDSRFVAEFGRVLMEGLT